jgi:hypothetical protein
MQDTFDESLLLKSLPSGSVLAHFSFSTTKHLGQLGSENEDYAHFNLFPKVMGQAMRQSRVSEFRLSLTSKKAGRWDQIRWGEPLSDAPGGAELWAEIESSGHDRGSDKWSQFRSTLAGTFCSSLGLIGEQHTVEPSVQMPGQTVLQTKHRANTRMFFGALPREAVCTENLTPWLKLLPCRRHAGLGSLMNPLKLFGGDYHSMKIHGQRVCDSGTDTHVGRNGSEASGAGCSLHLTQTFTAILAPWNSPQNRYGHIEFSIALFDCPCLKPLLLS